VDATGPAKKLRVFYALAPDVAMQRSLGIIARELAARVGGRAIVDANLHLTLAFIGDVAMEKLDVLRAIVARLPKRAFVLTLDRVGTFRHSELAWIAPSTVPAALAELQSTLVAALSEADFPLETRPFHAHVTLARRCTKRIAGARFTVLAWRVERVALLASIAADGGVSYRELAGVALAAP
jgi:RNA 2',3'-cyclic 3'-phosphodiesterase